MHVSTDGALHESGSMHACVRVSVRQANVEVLAFNETKRLDIYCCEQTIRKGPWPHLLY